MSYVFGMSFVYRKYRSDSTIRIYADNNLVDELSLGDDINLKTIQYDKKLIFSEGMGKINGENDPGENYCRVLITPEKLFLFEIDEKCLTNSIRLEFDVDQNNYTNGFMSKFSYIRFYSIFLFPDCFLQESSWRRLNHLRSYKQKKMPQWMWPTTLLFSDVTFNNSAYQCTHDIVYGNTLSGKFTMNIPLTKKHKIIQLGKERHGRAYLSPNPARILSVFNSINTNT